MSLRNVVRMAGVCALIASASAALAQAPAVSEQIMVDQFGYRAAGRKLAIFASPEKGFNSNVKYAPPAKAVIRSAAGNAEVMTVELKEWNGGKVDRDSGDKVWHADFTALEKPGLYYLYDAQNKVRSYDFRVAEDPYAPILKAAVGMLFYNRCGCDLPAGNASNWAHPACHVNANQDKEAQLYVDGKLMGHPRDVHGGWHDAGDYDKYVPFTMTALGCLLAAYEWNPSAFGDDWGIPESGNGMPDLLDEIKVEMDWMLRMQVEDGSVCNRVGARGSKGGVSPELDPITRFYAQPTSWATATAAAQYAHTARVFGQFAKTKAYAKTLQAAAEKAWAWLDKHPDMVPADGRDHASPSDASQCEGNANQDRRNRFIAACELLALDGQAKYGDFVKEHLKDSRMADNDGQPFVRGWFAPAQGDEILRACLDYAASPKADPAIVADVKAALRKGADGDYVRKYAAMAEPYMAPVPGYWWGSNQIKAECGDFGIYAVKLGVNPPADAQYRAVSEEFVHYFHGRNPLCLVYLTNMGERGAKAGAGKCVMQPFHTWWINKNQWDGPNSKYGPAPGFLVGGPNPTDVPSWVSPPSGQPPAKAFKDWNGNWNTQHNATENSWAITEPAIYYQARYVLLLSQFVGKPPAAAGAVPRQP